MRIRGLALAMGTLLLAGCGGHASAAEGSAQAPSATQAAVDVEQIARDEIIQIDALGYPTELVTWEFQGQFTNVNGGTAWSSGGTDGYTTVTISTDPEAYRQFSDDIEAAVRSTVRHEFGHALTFWMYPLGAEAPLSAVCEDVTPSSEETGSPAAECAAEALSLLLSEMRGGERVAFYSIAPSDASLSNMAPVLAGSLAWIVSQ